MSLTSDEHDDYGEYLLSPGVGRDVPESDRGERGAGVVERGDVGVGVGDASAVRKVDALGKEVQPA